MENLGLKRMAVACVVGSAIGMLIGQYVTLGDHWRPELRPDYSWVANLPDEYKEYMISTTGIQKRNKISFEDAVKINEAGSLQKKLQGAVGK